MRIVQSYPVAKSRDAAFQRLQKHFAAGSWTATKFEPPGHGSAELLYKDITFAYNVDISERGPGTSTATVTLTGQPTKDMSVSGQLGLETGFLLRRRVAKSAMDRVAAALNSE